MEVAVYKCFYSSLALPIMSWENPSTLYRSSQLLGYQNITIEVFPSCPDANSQTRLSLEPNLRSYQAWGFSHHDAFYVASVETVMLESVKYLHSVGGWGCYCNCVKHWQRWYLNCRSRYLSRCFRYGRSMRYYYEAENQEFVLSNPYCSWSTRRTDTVAQATAAQR